MADASLRHGGARHQRDLEARCRRRAGESPRTPVWDAAGSLVDAVLRWAQLVPTSPAVAALDGTLTYGELTRRAAGLAAALGGAPPGHVGVLVGLGSALPVALLGVLGSGRAAVPLDPRYPHRRLAAIAASQALGAVVSGDDLAPRAVGLAPGAARLGLAAPIPAGSRAELRRRAAVDDPAVVMFTSGSTGEPKRVVHSQRSLSCEVRRYGATFALGPRERMLLVSSPCFADSLRTIWGALTHGAVLCPFDLAGGGLTALADFIDQTRITIYRSVPSVLRELDSVLPAKRRLPTVRLAYLAGEPVTAADVAICRRRFAADGVVVNGIGTSETLTFAWYLIGPETPLEDDGVPIGWPLAGREVRLVDQGGNPVTVGEVGEIEVLTPSLAPSVGDPSRPVGERAYRTGDLAVATADGCLSHRGRVDFQVKIRGFRVNPLETEAALAALGGVERAAVVGRSAGDGRLQLVAFVVTREPRPTVAALTAALRERLPSHQVPARIELVETLPRTASGKLDRRALLEVPLDERHGTGAGGPPRSGIQAAVCAIWEEVLGTHGIGIEDRFLDLGGDSLRAVRIGARVRDIFDVELTMADLLRAATPCEMAAQITAVIARSAGSDDAD